jgi:hypothetical protein
VTWLAHVLGLDNGSGYFYLWWSGIGADLGYLAVFASLVAVIRRHNCEVHRCWRLGRHATAAGHHVCRRHHPDDSLTAQDVARAHREAGS